MQCRQRKNSEVLEPETMLMESNNQGFSTAMEKSHNKALQRDDEDFYQLPQETMQFDCEKCDITHEKITWGGVPQYIECTFCHAQYTFWRDDVKGLVYKFVKFLEEAKSTSGLHDDDGKNCESEFQSEFSSGMGAGEYSSGLSTKVRNAFTLFGLNIKASKKQIKKRYHKLAFKYHPDKHNNISDEKTKKLEKTLKDIINAYNILSSQ